MDESPDTFTLRLDRIETQWSLLQRAHDDFDGASADARNALVLRYSAAIQRYVKAITRDDEDAHEVAQDAIIRLLKGDFAGADPNRGRFRDLLKVAVRNMVRNHWDKQNRRRTAELDVELMEAADADIEDDDWLQNWRRNVLDLTWSRLEEYQHSNEGSVAYTVLRLRSDHPALDSKQLAERLSTKLGREVRSDALRQQLRRARIRFAEMVVDEVTHGLDTTDAYRIQEELICLGIYEYVKDVLPEGWGQRDATP